MRARSTPLLKHLRRYLALPALLTATGCTALGPDYTPPTDAPSQAEFVAAPAGPFDRVETLPGSPWWQRAFDDPLLDALIAEARDSNLTLAQAVARLEAAEARQRAARRAFLPQGGVGAAVQRQEQANLFGGAGAAGAPGQGGGPGSPGGAPGQPAVFDGAVDIYSVSADLAWEIDLFGRLRATAARAEAAAEAEAALLADAERLVVARTASAYLDWVEARARRAVAMRNLDAQEDALELSEARLRLGDIARFDFIRQRTQTNLTRARAAQLAAAEAEAVSALALLTGRTVPELLAALPPAPDADQPSERLPELRVEVAIDDPAAVLRRRPDVAAAERRLAATAYAAEIQTAALFPQVTLTGSAGLTALSADELTSSDAFGYGFGPAISWDIFSYPAILAERAAREAETRAALGAYEETVLTALTETDAALAGYRDSITQAAAITEAREDAQESLRLARARYEAGADSLLTFLDAQRTTLETEDNYIVSQIGLRRARVRLHRALGG
jgi:NodT family efflux transporter outer membrane factor (OMF) lipoprotein